MITFNDFNDMAGSAFSQSVVVKHTEMLMFTGFCLFQYVVV